MNFTYLEFVLMRNIVRHAKANEILNHSLKHFHAAWNLSRKNLLTCCRFSTFTVTNKQLNSIKEIIEDATLADILKMKFERNLMLLVDLQYKNLFVGPISIEIGEYEFTFSNENGLEPFQSSIEKKFNIRPEPFKLKDLYKLADIMSEEEYLKLKELCKS